MGFKKIKRVTRKKKELTTKKIFQEFGVANGKRGRKLQCIKNIGKTIDLPPLSKHSKK